MKEDDLSLLMLLSRRRIVTATASDHVLRALKEFLHVSLSELQNHETSCYSCYAAIHRALPLLKPRSPKQATKPKKQTLRIEILSKKRQSWKLLPFLEVDRILEDAVLYRNKSTYSLAGMFGTVLRTKMGNLQVHTIIAPSNPHGSRTVFGPSSNVQRFSI